VNKHLHFISGLPRSGSTLLAAILRQNPRVHADITSPVGGLFTAMLNAMSVSAELAAMISAERKRRVLTGLFEGFYGDLQQEIVFDTSRAWCAKLWSIAEFFPDAKVICCVRNVAWIMDSFERAVRRNPLEVSRLFNDENERNSVYARVETLAQRNRIVGHAWSALKEAYYGEHSDRLLLVEYDLLAERPRETLQLIYEFIGEPMFEHDFDDVRYEAVAFDAALGTPGLHRVAGRVEFRPRSTILPPDLFKRHEGMSFWQDKKGTRAAAIARGAASDPMAPEPES
jgi:sulfotransferase